MSKRDQTRRGGQKATHHVSVRLTDDELEGLKAIAGAAKVSMGAAVRLCLLARRIHYPGSGAP